MVKLGLHLWPTTTAWPSLREAAMQADSIGWDSIWTADHLLSSPDPTLPVLEGWTTIAAFSAVTKRVSVGLLVAANSLRNPGVTAKLASTLDHISSGRAVLGLGAGWFAEEHRAFGIPFEARRTDRARRLDESAALIRRLLAGDVVTDSSGLYAFTGAICRPAPIQKRLPILVGGSTPEILSIVVDHADMWNTRGSIAEVGHSDRLLRELCGAAGREQHTIERTLLLPLVIRNSVREAHRVWAIALKANGLDSSGYLAPLLGEPERVAEGIRPYVTLGFDHIIVPMPVPDDHETILRLPELRAALG